MNIIEESNAEYKYFVLKNGPRITSFRVKADELSNDLGADIENMLKIYPDGSEIYPITEEEHITLHRANLERRRIVRKARKRCIDYNNAKFDTERIVDVYNTFIK